MQPILSICIPTYNRANWLRSSLWNWLPQVNGTNGLVELIVCDNASSDRTKEIINEANNWGEFQYYCNSENIGPVRNMYRLVSELAKGKFIWVVGDDDLPNINALQIIVDLIKKDYSSINYIYLNYSYWNPSKEQSEIELLNSKDLDFSQVLSSELGTKFVDRVADLVSVDINCFTPIYCSIMLKEDACKAFKIGILGETYSSIETTIPHALYIAKELLNQRALYIGYPCILASYNISWMDISIKYIVEYIPSLYKSLEKNGCEKSVLNSHRQTLTSRLPSLISVFKSHNDTLVGKFDMMFKRYINYSTFTVLGIDINYVLAAINRRLNRTKF